MAVTVKIPAQLRAVTDGEDEVEVDGETVGEALDAVFDAHSDLRERITEDGTLRRFVNVFVSGEDIRFQDGLETPLSDGDEVTILPAVAGGSPSARHNRGRAPVPAPAAGASGSDWRLGACLRTLIAQHTAASCDRTCGSGARGCTSSSLPPGRMIRSS